MKITTQLHINRLHIRTLKTPFQGELISELDHSNFESQIKNGIIKVLPFSILDIIKSFLFYDIKTYEIIENTKLNKEKFLYLIDNSFLNRSNNFDDMSDYSDNLEHWAFGFGENSDEKLSMQAINCYLCGNYILHSGNENLFSDNIYCKCENNDYSSNYSSYNDDNSSDYSLD
jgi:hypothetical protein